MDIHISQIKIDLENVVDATLVTTGTFYKQLLPIFQEMTNSCSTNVNFDECVEVMINKNMKHINAKGINTAYGISQGYCVVWREVRGILNVISMHTKGDLKSNEQRKIKCYMFFNKIHLCIINDPFDGNLFKNYQYPLGKFTVCMS